jgi:hypothetical protein
MKHFTLEDVAVLIAARGTGCRGAHLLFVADGELRLVRRTMRPVGASLIAILGQKEIREGLTANRWNHIAAKLNSYNEQHP